MMAFKQVNYILILRNKQLWGLTFYWASLYVMTRRYISPGRHDRISSILNRTAITNRMEILGLCMADLGLYLNVVGE